MAWDSMMPLKSELNSYEKIAKHWVLFSSSKTLINYFSRASSGKHLNLKEVVPMWVVGKLIEAAK